MSQWSIVVGYYTFLFLFFSSFFIISLWLILLFQFHFHGSKFENVLHCMYAPFLVIHFFFFFLSFIKDRKFSFCSQISHWNVPFLVCLKYGYICTHFYRVHNKRLLFSLLCHKFRISFPTKFFASSRNSIILIKRKRFGAISSIQIAIGWCERPCNEVLNVFIHIIFIWSPCSLLFRKIV